MPQPCRVCAHIARAEIDRRLAVQVVNVSSVARDYGLSAKAVSRHRARHLPDFLVGLTARAQLPDIEQLGAEAQRLYLTTLDALARAEAGVLADTGVGRLKRPAVSHTAVAAYLREARQGLELLARLADNAEPRSEVSPISEGLESRITAALDARANRLKPAEIESVIVVETE